MRGPTLMLALAACGRIGFDPVGDLVDAPGACAAQLALGTGHLCVRLDNGALWCWGQNSVGELGNGTVSQTPMTVPAPAVVGPYTQIAVGIQHSCGLRSDGVVECWGSDSGSQLGPGGPGGANTIPIPITGLGIVDEIVAASSQTCAHTGATWWCWGDGDGGQFGDGTAPDYRDAPGPIDDPVASRVACGADHGCAITPRGVRCWGVNSHGQLGVDPLTTTDSCEAHDNAIVPCSLAGVSPAVPATVTQLALGQTHSCALDASERVWCWGDNSEGELGDGSLIPRSTPQLVPGLSGVRQIAVGRRNTYALLADGTVQAWGDNGNGELGDGMTASRASPGGVAGLTDVRELASAPSGQSACARTGTEIMCWGENPTGILGDTGGASVLSPTPLLAACP